MTKLLTIVEASEALRIKRSSACMDFASKGSLVPSGQECPHIGGGS